MMDKKDEIIKIWRECFPADTTAWLDMYFTNAYRSDCAMTLCEDNTTVCSLLLQPYTMTFHGEHVGTSYVSGAATRHQFRNHGYMTRLMKQALQSSRSRGDMLCTLIPANQRLYNYYSRLGFSTVFYTTILRYTSAHTFPVENSYDQVDQNDTARLYRAFSRLMECRNCCIQHTEAQFKAIMADNRLSNGVFTAIADDQQEIVAMAWAIPEAGSRTLRVTDILSKNEDAYNAALRELQFMRPNWSLTIMERPSDNSPVTLTPRGMARLLNPVKALSILAGHHPELKTTIRVSDHIIDENNATYSLSEGHVDTLPYMASGTIPDLDISIGVLTAILFSSHHIGTIMGLPATRPFMSLMMD